MAVRSFTVVYEKAEGGGYYAHVPTLALTTEGRTLKEAKAMACDAIGGILEAAKILGKAIPGEAKVEQIAVTV